LDAKDLHVKDSLTLGALAHPTRFAMLEALMHDTLTLTDLGRLLDEKPGKLRFHLMKLVKAGLAELVNVTVVGGFVEKRYRATMNRVVSESDVPDRDSDLASKRTLALTMVEVLTRQFRERLLRDPGGETFFASQTVVLPPAQLDNFFHDYMRVLETHLLPRWQGYTGEDAMALDLVTLMSTTPTEGGTEREPDSPNG
jgi:DNA-binding transcriptional ArsR family regulator